MQLEGLTDTLTPSGRPTASPPSIVSADAASCPYCAAGGGRARPGHSTVLIGMRLLQLLSNIDFTGLIQEHRVSRSQKAKQWCKVGRRLFRCCHRGCRRWSSRLGSHRPKHARQPVELWQAEGSHFAGFRGRGGSSGRSGGGCSWHHRWRVFARNRGSTRRHSSQGRR